MGSAHDEVELAVLVQIAHKVPQVMTNRDIWYDMGRTHDLHRPK